MTQTYRIGLIPGDGVGTEVIESAREVLDYVAKQSQGKFKFDYTEYPWGSEYYLKTGRMMENEKLDELRGYDALFLGAAGFPTVPDHITLWGLRLAITQPLDQYVNVRPVYFYPGVKRHLNYPNDEKLSWYCIRENSEGEYAGIGGRNFSGRPGKSEVAVQSALFTEVGCERIIRFAFEFARKKNRLHVTSVTKSNAQQYAMVMWDDIFKRVAAEYPDVKSDSCLIDAMAARFVTNPEQLDVVVGSNLFGDILSDLGGAMAGSIGLSASVNLDPERRNPSMFESVHGSAPDIAGKGIANPIGTIESAAMLLEYLGLEEEAKSVQRAIPQATASGVLTQDIGGKATTKEMTQAIIDHIKL